MSKHFMMEVNDGAIEYIFNPNTKNAERHSVIVGFDDIGLDIGDYTTYPLDLECPWIFIDFITGIPKAAALAWFDHLDIKPLNKALIVVNIRNDRAMAIYVHDFSYTLYRMKKTPKE